MTLRCDFIGPYPFRIGTIQNGPGARVRLGPVGTYASPQYSSSVRMPLLCMSVEASTPTYR